MASEATAAGSPFLKVTWSSLSKSSHVIKTTQLKAFSKPTCKAKTKKQNKVLVLTRASFFALQVDVLHAFYHLLNYYFTNVVL